LCETTYTVYIYHPQTPRESAKALLLSSCIGNDETAPIRLQDDVEWGYSTRKDRYHIVELQRALEYVELGMNSRVVGVIAHFCVANYSTYIYVVSVYVCV
jgi:hypothetical protein